MSFTLCDIQYYKADYVRELNSAFFHGCARTIRLIITKKNIPSEHYTYATFSKRENKWTLSEKSVNKASLLLTKEWVDANVPGFGDNDKKLELENAPPLLYLKDEEKIKDEHGNVLEIETRGEKTVEGIYFYGRDIERILDIEKLRDTLNNVNGSYSENVHYKKFIRTTTDNYGMSNNKFIQTTTDNYGMSNNKREAIFLTYFGLVKVLISRRHKIAEQFQRWAVKTLFTVQMGTTEDKQELCSKLLGCDITSVRSFLNTGVSEYSELYLICLGKISDLSDSIPELKSKDQDEYLFKYGYTSDLTKRLQQHRQTFNKIKGSSISLCLHCPIDKQYLSQAEVELKQSFKTFNYVLDHPVYKELVYFDKNKLSQFEKIFKIICEKYAGNCKKLQEQLEQYKIMKEYENREMQMKHNIEILELKNKLIETQSKLTESELKLKHEQEMKNIEKQFKDYLLSVANNNKN